MHLLIILVFWLDQWSFLSLLEDTEEFLNLRTLLEPFLSGAHECFPLLVTLISAP